MAAAAVPVSTTETVAAVAAVAVAQQQATTEMNDVAEPVRHRPPAKAQNQNTAAERKNELGNFKYESNEMSPADVLRQQLAHFWNQQVCKSSVL